MPQYKTPLRDMRFVFNELLNSQKHYETFEAGKEATPDMVDAILEECAKLCEDVLSPLYQSGDKEGCRLEGGKVITPSGFKDAYALCYHSIEFGYLGGEQFMFVASK